MQLGEMVMLDLSRNVDKSYAIYPLCNFIVEGYDPQTGLFPKPPCEEDGYAGLPDCMIDDYQAQAKALYKRLVTQWPKDVLASVLNPYGAGLSDDPANRVMVCGKVDDGPLCLWAAMNRYRQSGAKYQRKLKRNMMKSPFLFRHGDPKKHIMDLRFTLTECLALGVRLPWDEIGLEIINVLSGRHLGVPPPSHPGPPRPTQATQMRFYPPSPPRPPSPPSPPSPPRHASNHPGHSDALQITQATQALFKSPRPPRCSANHPGHPSPPHLPW